MLFGQQGKVKGIGKNNFHNIMKQETHSAYNTHQTLFQKNDQFQNTHQRQTELYINNCNLKKLLDKRHVVQKVQQNVKFISPSEMIDDGACQASGSTWDAQHLDSFLKKSKFASMGESIYKPTLTATKQESIRQSFFLRNPQARLAEEKSAAHYFFNTSINPMVIGPSAVTTNNKLLNVPEKYFDQTKIYYTPKPDELLEEVNRYDVTQPSEQKRQMIESIKNIEDYQSWRKDFFNRNKGYRIAKQGFRSGIVNIDNPDLPDTVLYKEEHEANQKLMMRSADNHRFREKILEKFTNTNPSVEFDNKIFNPSSTMNAKDQLLNKRNTQFPLQNYELGAEWINRREVKLPFVVDKKNTEDRIFGNNSKEINNPTNTLRSQYLRQQEKRGRNYNIVALIQQD